MLTIFKMIKTLANSNLCASLHLEEFSNKLEEGSKLCESYGEGTAIQKYRVFRITDRENGINNLLRLYESVYGKIEHVKMYTIITFVTLNKDGANEYEKYRRLFTKFVVNYIRKKEDCFIAGNVYMTIDCIPTARIKDYDFIDTNVVNIKKVLHKIDEMVAESFYEMTFTAIKEQFAIQVDLLLCKDFFDDDESMLKRYHLVNTSYCKLQLEDITETMTRIVRNENLYFFLRWDFCDNKSIYKRLCNIIPEYEQTLGLKYFTIKPKEMRKYFKYLTNVKYKFAFDKSAVDVIERISANLNEEKSIERFALILLETYEKTVQLIQSKIEKDDCIPTKWIRKSEIIPSIFRELDIIQLFKNYFMYIGFGEIQRSLEQRYEMEEYIPIQRPPAENISKILFDDELTETSVYTLFHSLKDVGVLEKISANQTIYVERGSLVMLDKSVIAEKKRISEVVKLKTNFSSISAATETIEKCVHPCAESMDLDPKKFSKTREESLSICADDKLAIRTESNKKLEDVKITIVEYKKLISDTKFDGLIEQLEDMCLDSEKYNSINKRMVSIAHSSKKSYIYIIYQFDAILGIYKLSLIYNIYSKSLTGNCTEFGIPNRIIQCFDNGPLLLLNNLHGSLQCMQLAAYDEFEIPNLLIINNVEYAYNQITTHVNLYKSNWQPRKNVFARFMIERDDDNVYAKISLLEILLYMRNGLLPWSSALKDLICHLGITNDEFFQILYKSIFDSHTFDKYQDILSFRDSLRVYDIDIVAKKLSNGSKMLRIYELREVNYYQYLSINFPNLLSRLSEYEAFLDVTDEEKQVLDLIFPKVGFTSLIIKDLLIKFNFFIDTDCFCGIENFVEYVGQILSRLDEIRLSNPCLKKTFEYPKEGTFTPSTLTALTLRKGMREVLKFLFKVTFHEYRKINKRQVLRTTTIIIKGNTNHELHDKPKRLRRVDTTKYYTDVDVLGNNVEISY